MALTDPHPALKVAAPQSPMVDGWMGDDWLNYGAFRQVNFNYFAMQTEKRGKGTPLPSLGYDDYSTSCGSVRLATTRASPAWTS